MSSCVSSVDPSPVEPSEDPDQPGAAPDSANDKQDKISAREKRKMKDSLDAFVERG